MHEPIAQRQGIYYALAAYGLWGLAPIYFKAVAEVNPLEVLAHRVVWSVLLLALLLGFSRRSSALWQLLKQPRTLAGLGLTAVIVSINWGVFIWAVGQGRILETSLGYFINPLISLLLGMLFLGERLRRGQWLAIAMVVIAVGYQLVLLGRLPWVALTLALSFGCYGLVRKKLHVDPVLGVFVETLLLLPIACLYLLWLGANNQLAFIYAGTNTTLLLLAAGIVTSVPLLYFAAATRRLSLTMMGMLQYLGPSITFILAVFYYQEPLDEHRLFTFLLIWAALLLFSAEGWRTQRHRARALDCGATARG